MHDLGHGHGPVIVMREGSTSRLRTDRDGDASCDHVKLQRQRSDRSGVKPASSERHWDKLTDLNFSYTLHVTLGQRLLSHNSIATSSSWGRATCERWKGDELALVESTRAERGFDFRHWLAVGTLVVHGRVVLWLTVVVVVISPTYVGALKHKKAEIDKQIGKGSLKPGLFGNFHIAFVVLMPITTQHLSCASTSQCTQDPSTLQCKRTALVVNSSESDHTDEEGRPRDIPRQSYDGLLQANSHVASVLQVEVPHEEYDSPANGRVCRQCTTSGSVPDHRRMQGQSNEAENHLESDRSSSTTTEAPRKSRDPVYKGVIMRPSSNADGYPLEHKKARRQALSTDNLPFSGFDSKSGNPASMSSSHGSHPPLQHRVTGNTAPPPGLPQPPVLSPACEAERLAGVDVDGQVLQPLQPNKQQRTLWLVRTWARLQFYYEARRASKLIQITGFRMPVSAPPQPPFLQKASTAGLRDSFVHAACTIGGGGPFFEVQPMKFLRAVFGHGDLCAVALERRMTL
ncbi:hypothetical protein BU15DRAFT_68243 [Melanogaster broomeanus]|nr:hypothetical protein BU15DRAFT_68243 [Melanogaster broomeanus]